MPRIVRITSIVTLVVEIVVEVDVASLGGGGGSAAPGECMIPANAETASVILRATTAPVRRNVFIVVPPRVIESFVSLPEEECKIFKST